MNENKQSIISKDNTTLIVQSHSENGWNLIQVISIWPVFLKFAIFLCISKDCINDYVALTIKDYPKLVLS